MKKIHIQKIVEKMKWPLVWLIMAVLFLVIAGQSSDLFTLAYPKHQFFFTFLTAVSTTLFALAVMQSFPVNWWVRLPVLVIAYIVAVKVLAKSDWAIHHRWPSGWPEGDASLTGADQIQGAAGGLALLSSALLALVWICVSAWLSRQSKKTLVTDDPEQ